MIVVMIVTEVITKRVTKAVVVPVKIMVLVVVAVLVVVVVAAAIIVVVVVVVAAATSSSSSRLVGGMIAIVIIRIVKEVAVPVLYNRRSYRHGNGKNSNRCRRRRCCRSLPATLFDPKTCQRNVYTSRRLPLSDIIHSSTVQVTFKTQPTRQTENWIARFSMWLYRYGFVCLVFMCLPFVLVCRICCFWCVIAWFVELMLF